MKKILKSTMLIVIAMIGVIKISAAPIFGIAGQGMPNYNSQQNFWGCDPGWQWCSIKDLPQAMALDLRNLRAEYVALDVDGTDDVYVVCPMDFSKVKFTRMFANKQFVVSYPIILDVKMSEAINSRLKTKLAGRLALAPGTYKFEISGRNIKLRNIKVIIQEEAIRKINALGDIEQLSNWDGTIKGMFQIKNPDIFISYPGVNKLIELLNSKEGVKAQIVTHPSKTSYLNIVEKSKDLNISEVREIDNNGPLDHISGVRITCEGTCENGCLVSNAAGWSCRFCEDQYSGAQYGTGRHKCSKVIRDNPWHHEWVTEVTAIFLDEGNTNTDNPALQNLAASILGSAYKIKATELKSINKEKYVLLFASNNSKSIILINKLSGQDSKTVTTGNWMAFYNQDLKLVDKNISSLIRKSDLNNQSARKYEYVGQVTLLR